MAERGKKTRFKHDNSRVTKRIGSGAPPQEPESTDHLNPTFSFRHVDPDNYLLRHWEKDEIGQLIERLKMMERMTWLQIKASGGQGRSSGGLGFKPLNLKTLRCRVPDFIAEEHTLTEFRVSQKMRVMGYRDGATFCIVWFDRSHDVTGS